MQNLKKRKVKTMDESLTLNDGTVIDGGYAGYSQGRLWCYFTGYTMQQAATMFLDPAKTSHIVYQYGGHSTEYDGFTECTFIGVDVDGKCSLSLAKGVEESVSN